MPKKSTKKKTSTTSSIKLKTPPVKTEIKTTRLKKPSVKTVAPKETVSKKTRVVKKQSEKNILIKNWPLLVVGMLVVFLTTLFLTIYLLYQPLITNVSTQVSLEETCSWDSTILNLERCSVAVGSDDYQFGSGMVVRQGYVLTNYHVIDRMKNLYVSDGVMQTEVEIVATEEDLDLALLKLANAELFATCVFNQDEELEVLAPLVAVGWPYNASGSASFTQGTLSRYSDFDDERYLQVDINVSPGNSGGPIADECGVVGINSFKFQIEQANVYYKGFDFALPSITFLTWVDRVLTN